MAVLLTYLYLTFIGGSSAFLDFISERIDDVKVAVLSEEQQTEAINILALMGERSKEYNKQVTETDKNLSKLIENRNSNTSDIIAISDNNFENIESYSSDMLELRFQLKEHMTREEWGQVFGEE